MGTKLARQSITRNIYGHKEPTQNDSEFTSIKLEDVYVPSEIIPKKAVSEALTINLSNGIQSKSYQISPNRDVQGKIKTFEQKIFYFGKNSGIDYKRQSPKLKRASIRFI